MNHARTTIPFFSGLILSMALFFWITNEPQPTVQVYAAEDTSELVVITQQDEKQIQCLAKNIAFEAADQNIDGKIAVAQVVMNRTKDPKFPKTPCEVITQKNRRGCQFSWFCKGKWNIKDQNVLQESLRIAEEVYLNNVEDITDGSLYYHADYVRPYWRKAFQVSYVIGDHIFYKPKG